MESSIRFVIFCPLKLAPKGLTPPIPSAKVGMNNSLLLSRACYLLLKEMVEVDYVQDEWGLPYIG